MSIRDVIIVTDGDLNAKKAVEIATKNVGGRCISLSSGNPTMLTGTDIIKLIKTAAHDPVVVMVDDRGKKGMGKGETVLKEIIDSRDIRVLGVVAVASNGKDNCGLKVDYSINKDGIMVEKAVDKNGCEQDSKCISGDTISILKSNKKNIPIIIGIGDPGKMDGFDDIEKGAPITTLALSEVIKYNKETQ